MGNLVWIQACRLSQSTPESPKRKTCKSWNLSMVHAYATGGTRTFLRYISESCFPIDFYRTGSLFATTTITYVLHMD